MINAFRIALFMLLGVFLVALLAGGVTVVLRQLDLYPPASLSIAAGVPGSAYHANAQAYRAVLARDGIELRVLETGGSVENASLLGQEDGADIALVQGGVPMAEHVEGLAAVYLEPLWFFARDVVPSNPNQWDALRVTAGAPGSGTRKVADALAEITGAAALHQEATVPADSRQAATALLAGNVDIALFVAPAKAPYLEPVFAAPAMRFLALAHGEAIAERLPGARLVRIPAGILDYARPLPEVDMHLVALVTRLVARDGLHPALVNRLIHAVKEVHGDGDAIPANRQYPATRDLGIPPNAYASQLLEKGFSPLEQLLPYWVVAQLNRVLLVLLPAIFLLLPLLRLLPALYQLTLRRRVFGHYKQLHDIDNRLAAEGSAMNPQALSALRAELDEIEQRVLDTNLPSSYRKQAYTLLNHLEFVRRRSEQLSQRAEDPLTPGEPSAPGSRASSGNNG